jgi:hypothetical protein
LDRKGIGAGGFANSGAKKRATVTVIGIVMIMLIMLIMLILLIGYW